MQRCGVTAEKSGGVTVCQTEWVITARTARMDSVVPRKLMLRFTSDYFPNRVRSTLPRNHRSIVFSYFTELLSLSSLSISFSTAFRVSMVSISSADVPAGAWCGGFASWWRGCSDTPTWDAASKAFKGVAGVSLDILKNWVWVVADVFCVEGAVLGPDISVKQLLEKNEKAATKNRVSQHMRQMATTMYW